MRYSLATLWRRQANPRRKEVTLRPIVPPSLFASNLYASSYAPVTETWAAAWQHIQPAYDRALSDLTQDSPEELGSRIDDIEREASAVIVRVKIALSVWAASVELWQRRKWRGAVLTATQVDLNTIIGAGDMRGPMIAAIERNVGLVKSVSDQARQRISQAVFSGLRARKPAVAVAREIQEAVAMSRRRAKNIASDQLTKLSSELAAERRREAGIDTWAWVSSHKLNYRPEHAARDGKRYSDSDPPPDLPGELINCGCTERAVLSLDGEF